MTRPPRPIPPSAIDGYRRLDRTSTIQAARPVAPRRRLGRRLASSLRLVAFVGVLVIIVGTSVSLAGSRTTTRTPAKREPAVVTVTQVKPVATPTARERAAEKIPTPKTKSTPIVAATEPAAADAATDAAAAPREIAAPTGALPLTGVVDVSHMLLAGSVLVLLGMLVQIAGTPLPARAAR